MICKVDGCGKHVVAQELCGTHYKRLQRHGSIEQTRPTDWGKREDHPLYQAWCYLRKTGFDIRWKDFWAFVESVKERPTEDFVLKPIDNSQEIGPDNFQWVEKRIIITGGEQGKAYQRAYAKKFRKEFPEIEKNRELKKRFGITIEDYRRMCAEQNGRGHGHRSQHRQQQLANLLCVNCPNHRSVPLSTSVRSRLR